jgi:pre-mRNA-splicing factor RBM22/SLT11
MATVKRDGVKQSWESDEFPLVCETCLGDNPYVRMTREEHGKRCGICETPFTVFAWQAGTKGRLKRVEICRNCAATKNVCQVCIFDLRYGLPVKVRDQVLREHGGGAAVSTTEISRSMANRAWATAQQQRALALGQDDESAAANNPTELAHAKLQGMAQMDPCYERNLPRLCSFFARGECDRGSSCPFRHEMPKDRNDPLSHQNTRARFFGTDDPVANKILDRLSQQQQKEQEARALLDTNNGGAEQARATIYIRWEGREPYPNVTEMDVRDKFYAFGEITSVRCQQRAGQVFVEYAQPDSAEMAIATMNRKELLGRTIFCSWARASKRGETTADERRGADGSSFSGSANRAVASAGGAGKSSKKNKPVPKGFSVKLAPEVVAAGRPGGGPIRGVGAAAAQRAVGPAKPYYPSSDPKRLGSKST